MLTAMIKTTTCTYNDAQETLNVAEKFSEITETTYLDVLHDDDV